VVQRRAHLIGCEADASVEHRRTLRGGYGEVAVGDSDLGSSAAHRTAKPSPRVKIEVASRVLAEAVGFMAVIWTSPDGKIFAV
jgi:hypothetical protein